MFTFQYASIKTMKKEGLIEARGQFTFQYASIKTRSFILPLYQ